MVFGVKFFSGLGLFGGRGNATKVPEVKYKEFTDFRDLSLEKLLPSNGTPITVYYLTREFKGVVKESQSDLEGRYLDTNVIRGRNYTVTRTAISDPQILSTKLSSNSMEQTGEYKLIGEDLPATDKEITGFHIHASAGNTKAAVVIYSEDRKLADDIAKVVAEKCAEVDSGVYAMRWLISDSDYCTRGRKDSSGPLID